jgi:hypothetical protein
MDNPYHLLKENPEGNLSKGMGQLNGVYTQWFNPDFAFSFDRGRDRREFIV